MPPAMDQHELFPERLLGSLRAACRRHSLQILARATLGHSRPFETFALLTQLSDWALCSALPLVTTSQSPADGLSHAPFAILALGRLGTAEMDFRSDADLVFVAADHLSPEQREPWRRLAEQYIHAVSSQTREGSIVPVDTRLRPQGSAGDIVVTASSLCDYLSSAAQAWEALTWLKARPVAGNVGFGDEVVRRARHTLAARWSAAEGRRRMTEELAALRTRMEREGTGLKARGEFKHLPGSFYDIEYILGLLTFRHGTVEKLSLAGNVLRQIEALHSVGALDTHVARLLRSAAELFRSTDHAHRVITGASANRPPEPALAQRIAVLVHKWRILSAATAEALEEQVRAARAEVRRLYEKEFTSVGPPALQ